MNFIISIRFMKIAFNFLLIVVRSRHTRRLHTCGIINFFHSRTSSKGRRLKLKHINADWWQGKHEFIMFKYHTIIKTNPNYFIYFKIFLYLQNIKLETYTWQTHSEGPFSLVSLETQIICTYVSF